MGWMYTPPPIVLNNIIYVFCEKLRHLENKYLLKTTPFSCVWKKLIKVLEIEFYFFQKPIVINNNRFKNI
jgi:hypothetical protein